jgi:hypothetical protein
VGSIPAPGTLHSIWALHQALGTRAHEDEHATPSQWTSDDAMRASKRILDPVDRVSEILFGLIMLLTFTGSLSVAEAGREDIRTMLIGALGCNLAWGIIDAGARLQGLVQLAEARSRERERVRIRHRRVVGQLLLYMVRARVVADGVASSRSGRSAHEGLQD